MDERDPTGALGFSNVTRDLNERTPKGGTVYVFALPR